MEEISTVILYVALTSNCHKKFPYKSCIYIPQDQLILCVTPKYSCKKNFACKNFLHPCLICLSCFDTTFFRDCLLFHYNFSDLFSFHSISDPFLDLFPPTYLVFQLVIQIRDSIPLLFLPSWTFYHELILCDVYSLESTDQLI